MSTFPQTRIRIAADIFKYTAFGDILRSDEDDYRPKFRAGDDIQFEIGLFNNGELLDISGIAAITLEIKPLDTELTERFDEDDDADNYDLRGPDLSLTPIRSKTLPASELNAALIKSAWDSNAPEQCHALITLSSAESNIAAGDRWLTIGIVTDDSPGRIRTVCAGPIRVLGGGLSQAALPEANTPETYYNTAEADARFLKLANNLSDLADAATARGHLGLGEADSPTFAGLDIDSGGVVDFNDNRLREVGDAATGTDALNRQSADARYLRISENGADIADVATFRDNLSVYSRETVSMLTARDFPPSLYLDGPSGIVRLPDAVAPVFKGSSTIALRVKMPPRVQNAPYLFGFGNGNSAYRWLPQAGGSMRLTLWDGTNQTTVDILGGGPMPSASDSGWVWLVAAVDTATHLGYWYVDGDEAASTDISMLDLSAMSPLAPAIGGANISGILSTQAACYVSDCAIFNRALTAAEVAARFSPQPTSPIVPVSERQAQLTPTLVTDFAAGLDSWALNLGGAVGTWTHDSGHGVLSVTTPGSNAYYPFITRAGVLLPGQLYRVSFDYSVTSGICKFTGYYDGTNNTTPQETLIGSGTKTFTASRADGGALTLIFDGRNAFSLNIDNITATPVGAIAHYSTAQDTRVGYQLRDTSANALHGLLSATGCTWVEAGERGALTLSGFTADAWLGGSERALIPTGYRIAEIIATETAGVAVSNLALGTTANGINLVSSFSLLAGETKSLPVAAPFTAKSAAKPVHISDAPGGPWGGANVSLTFVLDKF